MSNIWRGDLLILMSIANTEEQKKVYAKLCGFEEKEENNKEEDKND